MKGLGLSLTRNSCRLCLPRSLRAWTAWLQIATTLVGLGLLLTGCRLRPAQSAAPKLPIEFDRQFLRWLVNYHHEGDRMIDPCSNNQTIRKELSEFCSTVDQQHKERVERMRSWLKDWYSEELPSTDSYALWLGSLNGQEFEREFLKEYSVHHEKAIKPITECSQKAVHPELRALCARIAPRQQQDVQELRKWRCDWFKDCN